MDFGNLAKASLHWIVGSIFDTPILDEEQEVVHTELIFLPAKCIDVGLELKGSWFLEAVGQKLLDFASEDIDTHVVNCVFQPSVLTILAVAIVALNKHYFLADDVDLISRYVAHHAARSGVGLLIIVSDTHASSDKNVEAFQAIARAFDGNETYVMCVYICVIVWWDGDGNFEFSWQICWTIKGLLVHQSITGYFSLLVIVVLQPNLMISSRGW